MTVIDGLSEGKAGTPSAGVLFGYARLVQFVRLEASQQGLGCRCEFLGESGFPGSYISATGPSGSPTDPPVAPAVHGQNARKFHNGLQYVGPLLAHFWSTELTTPEREARRTA